MADLKQAEMESEINNYLLPEKPDLGMIDELTYRSRDQFYKKVE